MQVNSGMHIMNGQPQQGYPPQANQPYPLGSQFVPSGQRPPAPYHQFNQPQPPASFPPVSDSMMNMKSVPGMHNGVFQGDNFPPPAGIGSQSAPMNAGLLPPSAAGRLPPQSSAGQIPGPAQFPPGVPTGHPRGMPPPSLGQIHQMQPVPGGGSQRPAGAMPQRPPGGQLPPATGPSLEDHVAALSLSNAHSGWHGVPPGVSLGQPVPVAGPNVSMARPPMQAPQSQRPAGPVLPPPAGSATTVPQGMLPPQQVVRGGEVADHYSGGDVSQMHGVQPPTSGPPRVGQPPPVGPPSLNQPGMPPQTIPPVNPGPQTMMNLGFAAESRPPNYLGQGPPMSGPMPTSEMSGAGQFPAHVPPHSQVNSAAMSGYGYSQPRVMQPGQSMGPAAGAPLSGPMSQPQPRKLDPDQMPSPIQVMEDDKRNHSGVFQSGQKGTVPPLVTTDFIVEDQGICSPRFLRSTMYNIPCTNDLLKQTHMPFALVLSPFSQLAHDELPLPVVDLGQMGPVRCNRCKAYMCPFMVFVDGGRKFQCSFCTCVTEVPPEYFNHLDHTGRRVDYYDRPELCLGAYEFVATSDYCKDGVLPVPPAYIFMIDISYQSIKSGLVNLLCARIKSVLADLPCDPEDSESEIRVGFVTYSNVLHFYNLKGSLAQPQMLVVSDVQDVFVPLLDGFLVKMSESEAMIDMLLSQIAEVFSDSRQTEVVLGPVIQAGLDALKSAGRAGKLFIFHSSLPSSEAPGKLKGRDDRNLLGTEKEKTLLSPQTNFYTKLGQECVSAGCSVDLFLFPNSYIDVATVSEVPRLTGGKVHKYSYFQADLGGDMLIDDLQTSIARQAAFDAVVRVRTSTGIRAVDFYGNLYMSNTTDVELAAVGCDTALAVEVKHDDKLSEAEGAYVQAAVLYTSVGGRRRLRVLNSAFNCCTQVADLFRCCELDTYVNFIAKQAVRDCLNSHSRQVRENLTSQCAQLLACYRKNCATPSSAGQLILPECMKLLPVYINCVIKSGILQSGDIATDDRSYEMHLANAMDVASTNVYFYPRLIAIHDIDVNGSTMPTPLRCSYDRLQDNGVYLVDNGLVLFMWIGLAASSDWVRDVLGVASVAQVDIDKTRLQEFDNPLSLRIRSLIKKIRAERHRHMKLIIVRQRDKLEPVLLHYLMEDRGTGGTSSYVDFLCHIHKEIRNLLS